MKEISAGVVLGYKPFDGMADTAVRLVLRVPYIMGLYYSMQIYELNPDDTDGEFATLCINGPAMWVNPAFWRQLSRNQKLTAVGHEIGHKMLLHNTRRGERNPYVWNEAGDHIINPMLVESGFEPLSNMTIDGRPWNWLYDLDLVKAGKGTTEGVYDVLIRRYEDAIEKERKNRQGSAQGKGSGAGQAQPGSKGANPSAGSGTTGKGKAGHSQADGGVGSEDADGAGTAEDGDSEISRRSKQRLGPMRDLQDFNTNPSGEHDDSTGAVPETPADFEQRVRKELKEAEMQAKLQGNAPGWMERVVGNAYHSKIDWWEIVEQWARSLVMADYSWSRFNRREYVKTGVLSPDVWQPALNHMLLFVDTSGSISGQEFGLFARHYNDMLEQIRPRKVTLVYCDTRPARVDVFERSEIAFDEQQLHPVGGGGTDFRWFADFIDGMDERPDLAMCLTDMYTSWGRDPGLPFLWLSTSSVLAAPYGEVIAVN